ncbi:MAG TPA: Gfo/Idh/MocA family oxidoreductase [Acidimicrobiales bacterium]|nr:Gfo/Idh/MocA family oxidoreductase [Acidimicrobiales bacterium]
MRQSYSAAIIGCGDIGHAHAEGYSRNENTTLVSVADPLEAARRQFQAEYGVERAFASAEEMLATVQPDIVSVCVWHRLHAPMALVAAQAGAKAVICEKPMAISLGEVDAMLDACQKSGTKLLTSYQRRFTPGWEHARELVASGAIGDARFGQARNGAGLLNVGSHTIDGMLFLLGEPAPLWVFGAVDRHTDRFERETPIEDACMLVVGLEGGAQLLIESDLADPDYRPGLRLRLDGTEGSLEATESHVRLLNSTSGGWHDVMARQNVDTIGGEANARLVAELVEWLDGGDGHRCDALRCRPTMEVMMACYESASRHRVVHLPMSETRYPLERMLAAGLLPPDEPGAYDIRAFLRREQIDEQRYAVLRSQGVRHHEIMKRLAAEAAGTFWSTQTGHG